MICGELGDGRELRLLSTGPCLRSLGHSKCQWFMVHESGEPAALQPEPEMPGGKSEAQQLPVESAVLSLVMEVSLTKSKQAFITCCCQG